MHGRRDMEIITYVLEGALEHRDGLGTGSVLRPEEFPRMSAGTGQPLETSDGAAVSGEIAVSIGSIGSSEVMLFDLA